MTSIYLTTALALLMSFSVFLSMPLIFYKKLDLKKTLFFNAIAIGILVFLLMDIYGDVSAAFGNGTLASLPVLIFLIVFAAAFAFFVMPKASRDPEENPRRTSILSAIGIGLQNLTEGLLFGSAASAGLLSIYAVSVIGFTFQNMTEGFPIVAPLLASGHRIKKRFVSFAFLLSGLPTLIGTFVGLVFFSSTAIIIFDALASAAILYVVLVLFHVNIIRGRVEDRKEQDRLVWRTYIGILAGFIAAFIVNYLAVV